METYRYFMCPECHSSLNEGLKCTGCGKQYSYRHGVFNLISNNLSGNQFYLNKIEIPNDKDGMDELFYSIWGRENLSDEELWKDYYSRFNKETLEAYQKQTEYVKNMIEVL